MDLFDKIWARLKAGAQPDQLEGMARYAIKTDHRLGLSIPELRKMAKEIGKDHPLALRLWKTGIKDAQILAAMVDIPGEVSEQQLEEWVKDFDSWDVCDQVCLNLFEKVPRVKEKIFAWSARSEEFVKRTAYTLIACLAWHDKKADDEEFIDFFPLLKEGAADPRNFVKKAVNWALRNIGKRNKNLNLAAVHLAEEISRMDSKSARWIAADALRELKSDAVQKRIISR